MATYTTQLKTIIENINGLSVPAPASQIPALIEKARPTIFGFDYTITDKTHKPILERKILGHYLFREIGFETVGLWNLKLNFKMNEIMPYYDELYKSAALQLEPLANYGFDETANSQTDSTANSNTTSKTDLLQTLNANDTRNVSADNTTNSTANSTQTDIGKDTNAYSETPQGSLSGVESLTYLTDARIIDSNNTTNTDSTGKTTANTTEQTTSEQMSKTDSNQNFNSDSNNTAKNIAQNIINRKGFQGTSQSELLQKYRETIINIDLMVIDALADLFMQLY